MKREDNCWTFFWEFAVVEGRNQQFFLPYISRKTCKLKKTPFQMLSHNNANLNNINFNYLTHNFKKMFWCQTQDIGCPLQKKWEQNKVLSFVGQVDRHLIVEILFVCNFCHIQQKQPRFYCLHLTLYHKLQRFHTQTCVYVCKRQQYNKEKNATYLKQGWKV